MKLFCELFFVGHWPVSEQTSLINYKHKSFMSRVFFDPIKSSFFPGSWLVNQFWYFFAHFEKSIPRKNVANLWCFALYIYKYMAIVISIFNIHKDYLETTNKYSSKIFLLTFLTEVLLT